MQRLRLSHTKPRLSVMIRNWQCQRISRQTRDLDKSSIVIRLSLFSTNCHFLVWLPLSWAAQEMVYRPLGWAQVCENQKLIIDILRVRAVMIITDHQEAGSWMGWQCVSPDRRCNTTLLWHSLLPVTRKKLIPLWRVQARSPHIVAASAKTSDQDRQNTFCWI